MIINDSMCRTVWGNRDEIPFERIYQQWFDGGMFIMGLSK